MLIDNGLELPCVVATLCSCKTMVTRVVCSCVVNSTVTSSKTCNDSHLWDQKFNLFCVIFLTGVIGQNISLWYAASYSHNQFYRMKMLFSVSKVTRPPNQSLVEYALDVLLCRHTCLLVGFKMYWLYIYTTIHKSSQIPESKLAIIFFNKYFL